MKTKIVSLMFLILSGGQSWAEPAATKVVMQIYANQDDSIPSSTVIFDQSASLDMSVWESSFMPSSYFHCAGWYCEATQEYMAMRKVCFVGDPALSCVLLDRSLRITAPIHEHLGEKSCESHNDLLQLRYSLINDYESRVYAFAREIPRCAEK